MAMKKYFTFHQMSKIVASSLDTIYCHQDGTSLISSIYEAP